MKDKVSVAVAHSLSELTWMITTLEHGWLTCIRPALGSNPAAWMSHLYKTCSR